MRATDLKPANCLIDPQGCVKIADMNISKVSKGGNMQVRMYVLSYRQAGW
jgi:serine/threonine protein kinase